MYTIGILALLYFAFEVIKTNEISTQKKLIAAFTFIFFYFLFNAIYEQSGGSLSLFAKDNLNSNLLGFTIDPNIVNNSSNTLFVVILSPLIGLLWLWMGGWFLSTSIGNKLSGVLASMWDTYDNKADFFWVNFSLLMFATLLMFALLKQLNKVMKENGIN